MSVLGIDRDVTRFAEAAARLRELAAAERKVATASAARMAHPVGSCRARVTTLNARHAIACEARDRIAARLRDECGVDVYARHDEGEP